MIRKSFPLAFTLVIGLAVPAAAQDFVVDLAAHDAGKSDQISIRPGTSGVVEIRNLVPTKKYSVSTRVRVIPIDALIKPGVAGKAIGGTDICNEADTAKLVEGALTPLGSEKDVDAKIQQILEDAAGCAVDAEKIAGIVRVHVRRLTVRVQPQITIGAGEELEVRVVREDNQIWTVTFSAGARGSWHTLYGFSFTPSRDETYFAKAEGDKFRVTRQFASDQELTFIPSIFWSWMPASREGKNVNVSPTAGLGFDSANPAVFGGVTITYNHNLGVIIGGVAQRQKRLGATYNPENLPLVATALTPEQLSRDTYHPNFFVGIAFRFGSNPFDAPAKKKDEPKTDDAKTETKKDETKKEP